jgi:hypothetical protein
VTATPDPAPSWRAGIGAIAVSRVTSASWDLAVSFVVVEGTPPAGASPIPPNIAAANLVVTDIAGLAIAGVSVTAIAYPPPPGAVLTVTISDPGAAQPAPTLADFSPYLLKLSGVTNLAGSEAWMGFLLSSGGPPDAVPRPPPLPPSLPPPPPAPAPDVDYLARDYASQSAVMLNRLAVLLPGFAQNAAEPADPLTTLVETLALGADYLGYYQDAVGTEAYLVTARRRGSIRRHARLLDYVLHEGCNARAFVTLSVAGSFYLGAGTPIVTRQLGVTSAVLPVGTEFDPGTVVFETMQTVLLDSEFNTLNFLVDPTQPVLQPGTVSAVLNAWQPALVPGAVLMIQTVQGSGFGAHPIRLTSVAPWTASGATPPDGTAIAWHIEDALPAPLRVAPLADGAAAAWLAGNVVLADCGDSGGPAFDLGPVPWGRPYRPTLPAVDITYAVPLPEAPAAPLSAGALLHQDPAAALPGISLTDSRGRVWQPWLDLLDAGAYSPGFTLDRAENGLGSFCFGTGVLGRRPAPGTSFQASARVGSGPNGNVPAGMLCQIVTSQAIAAVDNPMAAGGGILPEPALQAQLLAPGAYRRQLRGVTAADYAALAERNPAIRTAMAGTATGGTGPVFTVSVDTWLDIGDTAAVADDLAAWLAPFRVVGTQVQVVPPTIVGLAIVLGVFCVAGADVNGVRQRLAERFGTGMLPNGEPAYFNPRRFTLGQPVVLSDIVAAMVAVDGVAWVNTDARSDPRLSFGTLQPAADFLDSGIIPIGPNQLARVDNDVAKPGNGSIAFLVMRQP